MIRIQQLKLPVTHTETELLDKIAKTLKIHPSRVEFYEIVRRSLDARQKGDLKYVYQIDVKTPDEKKVLQRSRHNVIMSTGSTRYEFPYPGKEILKERPVIIGTGPAGLFCGWMLAKHGYRPVLLERGDEASVRKQKVDAFWNTGCLDKNSNVQYGEGGAGTFSDGKLNTSVKDPKGRNREVLRIFAEAGAPSEILYEQKPHLGTDVLIKIVETMRQQIEDFGGSFCFRSQVTDFLIEGNQIAGVEINQKEFFPASLVILAIGHSARDTFDLLYRKGIHMEAKSFAVGVRIEHPQEMINRNQYGYPYPEILGAASYKVTHQLSSGRGVYSFCMCPGGYVVNASSEEKMLAVNGMSYQNRGSTNANSAMIVTVSPEDYQRYHTEGVPAQLAGVEFQRHLEHEAWLAGQGKIPVQLFSDFQKKQASRRLGAITPCCKGGYMLSDIRSFLPKYIGDSLEEAILALDSKIHGFARPDCLLSGVESRTSSPVRILRGADFQSNISGLYPCGEGAGYAGGITSAAMDGLKIAEAICEKYKNF